MTKIHLQAAVRLQREVTELEKELKKKREWVGLTDEEIADIANSCRWSNTYHADFARAIEAKLRKKNT
jgi:hypothetical protein